MPDRPYARRCHRGPARAEWARRFAGSVVSVRASDPQSRGPQANAPKGLAPVREPPSMKSGSAPPGLALGPVSLVSASTVVKTSAIEPTAMTAAVAMYGRSTRAGRTSSIIAEWRILSQPRRPSWRRSRQTTPKEPPRCAPRMSPSSFPAETASWRAGRAPSSSSAWPHLRAGLARGDGRGDDRDPPRPDSLPGPLRELHDMDL